jgi:hypothetical protein
LPRTIHNDAHRQLLSKSPPPIDLLLARIGGIFLDLDLSQNVKIATSASGWKTCSLLPTRITSRPTELCTRLQVTIRSCPTPQVRKVEPSRINI